MTDFTRTLAELQWYEATRPNRTRAWSKVVDEPGLEAAIAMDQRAVDYVRVAFALDTAAFNSPDRAQLIHPDDPEFRRIVGFKP